MDDSQPDFDSDEETIRIDDHWVSGYQMSHHSIEAAWINNTAQVVLAISKQLGEDDKYDLILLTPTGNYLECLGECEGIETAMKQSEIWRTAYPKGEFDLEDD